MNTTDLIDYAEHILLVEGRAINLLDITEKEVKDWLEAKNAPKNK